MPIEDIARGWAEPLALALAAVLAALLAFRIGHRVVTRLTRHSPVLRAMARRMDRPLHLLVPLAALAIVFNGAPETLPGIEGVLHLVGVLLIAAGTWVAIAAVQGIADVVTVLNPQNVDDNLHARRVITQTHVLARIGIGVLLFAGVAFILMTFPRARQFGTSLLASAGLSALVIGIAARSVFGNLLAGLQIALSQPLRIDDVLIVEGEWGRVEEITGTYVVLKIWDERRLVIPLQWFIEHPFQNWTRTQRADHRQRASSGSTTRPSSSRCAPRRRAWPRPRRTSTAASACSRWSTRTSAACSCASSSARRPRARTGICAACCAKG